MEGKKLYLILKYTNKTIIMVKLHKSFSFLYLFWAFVFFFLCILTSYRFIRKSFLKVSSHKSELTNKARQKKKNCWQNSCQTNTNMYNLYSVHDIRWRNEFIFFFFFHKNRYCVTATIEQQQVKYCIDEKKQNCSNEIVDTQIVFLILLLLLVFFKENLSFAIYQWFNGISDIAHIPLYNIKYTIKKKQQKKIADGSKSNGSTKQNIFQFIITYIIWKRRATMFAQTCALTHNTHVSISFLFFILISIPIKISSDSSATILW